MLRRRYDFKTHKKRWCLVSRATGRVLEWFGEQKPSKEQVTASERRIQYFKHQKGG